MGKPIKRKTYKQSNKQEGNGRGEANKGENL